MPKKTEENSKKYLRLSLHVSVKAQLSTELMTRSQVPDHWQCLMRKLLNTGPKWGRTPILRKPGPNIQPLFE